MKILFLWYILLLWRGRGVGMEMERWWREFLGVGSEDGGGDFGGGLKR